VWVTSDPNDPEVRCARPAKYEYQKKVTPPGKLPHIERFTMCGKHASQKNRDVATRMGYTIKETGLEA
jgi:hypothetical protein